MNGGYRTMVGVTLGLLALATMARADVLPPDTRIQGLTYGQWGARWWQWAASIPTASNPVLDTTGDNAAVGQSGPVWFLAGTFGGPAVTRTCTVPAGKVLFFPILNAFLAADPTRRDAAPPDLNAMRAQIAAFIDAATVLECEVDGMSIGGFRTPSPVFDVMLPPDNVFGAPRGTYAPAVADGVHVMLEPLAAGAHTIHIKGTSNGFTTEVTYHLTVP